MISTVHGQIGISTPTKDLSDEATVGVTASGGVMHNKPKYKDTSIPFGLSVRRETIFTDYKNIFKKRIERRQTGLLKRLYFLKPFLGQGEEIFLITTGCSPVSSVERFWTGLNVFELKCSLLVFTDRRIFHIPATRHYSYRNSISHFYYSDCNLLRIKGLTLIAAYKNGMKEKFHHVSVREEKKIKAILKAVTLEEATPNGMKGRVHLCPRCTKDLERGKFICGNCGLKFKDRARARKISILYPGGGYFYTRHPFLGIGDAATEFILFMLIVLSLICNLEGVRYSGWGLVIFPIMLVFEKVLAVYHSNAFINEYIPKDKDLGDIHINPRS